MSSMDGGPGSQSINKLQVRLSQCGCVKLNTQQVASNTDVLSWTRFVWWLRVPVRWEGRGRLHEGRPTVHPDSIFCCYRWWVNAQRSPMPWTQCKQSKPNANTLAAKLDLNALDAPQYLESNPMPPIKLHHLEWSTSTLQCLETNVNALNPILNRTPTELRRTWMCWVDHGCVELNMYMLSQTCMCWVECEHVELNVDVLSCAWCVELHMNVLSNNRLQQS